MKMMRLFLLVFAMAVVFSCKEKVSPQDETFTNIAANTQSEISKLSVEQLTTILDKNPDIQLVDVRTEEEHNAGAIPNSINISSADPDFENKIKALDTSKPIYLYCRSGGRSARCSEQIVTMGFTEIYDLQGGYLKWEDQKEH